ncbi:MAG: hypothetical protein V4438_01225 [Patescibacteria group bacterium]
MNTPTLQSVPVIAPGNHPALRKTLTRGDIPCNVNVLVQHPDGTCIVSTHCCHYTAQYDPETGKLVFAE